MKKFILLTLTTIAGFTTIFAQSAMSSLPVESLSAQAKTSNHKYQTYHNVHQDFYLTYPTNIFAPKVRDGYFYGGEQTFISKDGRASIFVSGFFKPDPSEAGWLGVPLKQLYAQALKQKNRVVTYKSLGSNWYVISGIENGNVFYEKFILKPDRKLDFRIVYPQSQAKIYDAITEQVVKSLK